MNSIDIGGFCCVRCYLRIGTVKSAQMLWNGKSFCKECFTYLNDNSLLDSWKGYVHRDAQS